MSKILIVDDKTKVCQLMEKYLKAKGFATATAHNGEEALKKVLRCRPTGGPAGYQDAENGRSGVPQASHQPPPKGWLAG